MDWYLWLLVGWWALSALATVSAVGKPRKPTESSTAVVVVAISVVLAVGLVVTR
jgi:hypothetical protein